jgi:thioesterase domain-containing protein
MAQRFVADMRELRPHGPYLLMGYCSGGTIAFEVAQQLVAAGEEVAFLAGIETYDWGTAQSSRPTTWTKAYYNFQRLEFHLRNFLLLRRSDKWSFLKSKWNRAKSRTKNWRGMLAGWFSKQQAVSASGAVNMHELWRLHDAQADRYRPKPFPGKLLLIRPKKDYRSYVGKEELVATKGVQIVRIPAFPAGLMTPPYVAQVAKLVQETIGEGLRCQELGGNCSQAASLADRHAQNQTASPARVATLAGSQV